MVRDILLDDHGDLVVAGGDLVPATGADALRQHVSLRLQFFLGEWFLDDPTNPQIGTPLFQKVLIKNPDRGILLAVLRSRIEGTPGIAKVTALSLNYDKERRALFVSWGADSDQGAIEGATEIQT